MSGFPFLLVGAGLLGAGALFAFCAALELASVPRLRRFPYLRRRAWVVGAVCALLSTLSIATGAALVCL